MPKYAGAVFAWVFIGMLAGPWAQIEPISNNKVPRPEYKLTYYCACRKCCGKWSDGSFANGEKTSTCASPTIACNWLKFGTKVRIDGVIYTVRDRGAKSIFGTFKKPILAFDIYCSRHVDAINKGKYYTNNVEVMQ